MVPKIRWQLVFPYACFVLLTLGGLWLFLQRPACRTDLACIRQTVWVAALLLLLLVVGWAHYWQKRIYQPIRQLTDVAQRILQGDMQAHLLLPNRDEIGELARVFNNMTSHLADQLATLAEERRRLDTVLNYMADGVLIVDAQGYVLLLNPAAMAILHTTEKLALGRSLAEVVRHHQLIAIWQRCRRSGERQTEAVEVGRELFLQAIVTPFPHEGGFLLILQDLTQMHHLQTVRRDFVSNLSHELRTPLASLRAVVETLRDGALQKPEFAQRFLERAEVEVDTLTQMVEELLELSRIESGQVPLRLAPTAVASLVLIPLDRLRSQAQRKEIELVLDLPARLPLVLADAGRIQQVFTNLLHNAVKFTPPGGKVVVSAALSRRQRGTEPELVLQVKDSGYGIAEEDLPRIFERFYKSDRARTRGEGGTGLGLAIARHIVQAHNGRLWAESKEGRGSTFFFSLPLSQEMDTSSANT